MMFVTKYTKQFVAAAAELMPDFGLTDETHEGDCRGA